MGKLALVKMPTSIPRSSLLVYLDRVENKQGELSQVLADVVSGNRDGDGE